MEAPMSEGQSGTQDFGQRGGRLSPSRAASEQSFVITFLANSQSR